MLEKTTTMAEFLSGKELNTALENVISNAEEELLLISPFIKLNETLEKLLMDKLREHELHVQVLFGKNEKQREKSFNRKDLEFFMRLPHVTIKYENELHAKYYANEKEGLLTSMNLYSYSMAHNVEFGVYTKTTLLSQFQSESLDNVAWGFFTELFENNKNVVYQRVPKMDDGILGLGFLKRYEKSVVKVDNIDSFFVTPRASKESKDKKKETSTKQQGYCIRTGEKIAYNVDRPFTYGAYKSWAKFKNKSFGEKYCHKCGAKDKTSFERPLCRSCSN